MERLQKQRNQYLVDLENKFLLLSNDEVRAIIAETKALRKVTDELNRP